MYEYNVLVVILRLLNANIYYKEGTSFLHVEWDQEATFLPTNFFQMIHYLFYSK